MKILNYFLISLIKFYRYFISPFFLPRCRYLPTCSEYSIQSIKKFGIFKGAFLSLKRISKCHPWGNHGYDPVPNDAREK